MDAYKPTAAAVLLLAPILIPDANAATLTFDVNNYSVGADVTNAIPGVAIEYYSHQSGSPVIDYTAGTITTAEGCVDQGFPPCSPVNTMSLYGENSEYFAVASNVLSLDQAGFFSGLSLTFNNSINDLFVDAFSYTGDTLVVFAFDGLGAYLGFDNIIPQGGVGGDATQCGLATSPGSSFSCWSYEQTIDFTGEGVKQVWIGSSSAAVYLSGFSATAVPLPPALWLFGAGLIGLAGVANKQKP